MVILADLVRQDQTEANGSRIGCCWFWDFEGQLLIFGSLRQLVCFDSSGLTVCYFIRGFWRKLALSLSFFHFYTRFITPGQRSLLYKTRTVPGKDPVNVAAMLNQNLSRLSQKKFIKNKVVSLLLITNKLWRFRFRMQTELRTPPKT